MSVRSSALALGAAVFLGASKPEATSFQAFFRSWLGEQLAHRRRERDSEASSASAWSSLVSYVSDQIEDLSVPTYTALSATEIVDAGVCLVACVTTPEAHPDRKLYFVGAAGNWYYVPQDIMENGRTAAAHIGVTLAGLSVLQAAISAARRIVRS